MGSGTNRRETDCPAPDQLLVLLEGSGDNDKARAFREHLGRCVECQCRLDQQIAQQWQETDSLPTSGTRLPAADETALRALVDRMVQQKPNSRIGDSRRMGSDSAVGEPVPAPKRLGHYRIDARIAEGSQGVLYRAFDDSLQRTVAIKVFRHQAGTIAAEDQRFVREARAAAALNDERIVRVFQVIEAPDEPPFLVMEYVEGVSLRERLDQNRLDFRTAVAALRDAALGLAAAHAAGLVHRDIKPSNLLCDARTGLTRLTDFGLALDQQDAVRLTREGVLGTPAYMSPEQLTRPEEVDARSDIYSLGVVMYELLVGEVPFRGSLRMTLLQVAHDDPRPLRQLNEQIPADLETICLKAMARDRNRRFESATLFAEELERWQTGRPILSRPIGSVERLLRWCQRRPAVAGLTAALTGLAIVLLAVLWLGNASLRAKAKLARDSAAKAAGQRDAALQTLSELVFRLQDRFEQAELDVDLLQKDTLQIALDGLARLRQLPDGNELPGLPTAVAFRRMGETLHRLDRWKESRECLVRAERECRRLLDQPGPRQEPLAGLIETLWSRHDLEQDDPDSETSPEEWLVPATKAARELWTDEAKPESRLMLGKALMFEGRALFDGAYGKSSGMAAISPLEESRLILEPLLESDNEHKLAALPCWMEASALLAEANEDGGQPAKAKDLYRAVFARCEALAPNERRLESLLAPELALRFQYRQMLMGEGDTAAAEDALSAIESGLAIALARSSSSSGAFLQSLSLFSELSSYLDANADFEGQLFFTEQKQRLLQARAAEIPGDELTLLELARAQAEWAALADALEYPVSKVRKAHLDALDEYRTLSQRAQFDADHWHDYLVALVSAVEFSDEAGTDDLAAWLAEARQVRDEIMSRFPDHDPAWIRECDEVLDGLDQAPAPSTQL